MEHDYLYSSETGRFFWQSLSNSETVYSAIGDNYHLSESKFDFVSGPSSFIPVSWNVKLYQSVKLFHDQIVNYYKVIKLIYGKNAYITPESLELSPSKLFENIISGKCYFGIRFPYKVVTIDAPNEISTNYLTAPIRDMFVFIPIRVHGDTLYTPPSDPANLKVSINYILYGFQAGMDARNFMFSHLSANNDAFCLGATELATMVNLAYDEGMADTLDIWEHILNYIDIMLGCQSNTGGPYRKLENMYELRSTFNIREYIDLLVDTYFLCVPKEQWPFQIIHSKVKDGIMADIILNDVQLMITQLDQILPERYKRDIRITEENIITLKSVHCVIRTGLKCKFRFNDKYPTPYQFTSLDGYYIPKTKKYKTESLINAELTKAFYKKISGIFNNFNFSTCEHYI